jgi:pyridoxamine 5'-phosphate oxidase family protein
MFTDAEREYIAGQSLCRIATATNSGKPHVVPLRGRLDGDKVIIGGYDMSKSYKYKQAKRNPAVAVLWDGPGLQGIEVRGQTEVIEASPEPYFVITPTKVFSWGVNEDARESFQSKMGFDMSHQGPEPYR